MNMKRFIFFISILACFSASADVWINTNVWLNTNYAGTGIVSEATTPTDPNAGIVVVPTTFIFKTNVFLHDDFLRPLNERIANASGITYDTNGVGTFYIAGSNGNNGRLGLFDGPSGEFYTLESIDKTIHGTYDGVPSKPLWTAGSTNTPEWQGTLNNLEVERIKSQVTAEIEGFDGVVYKTELESTGAAYESPISLPTDVEDEPIVLSGLTAGAMRLEIATTNASGVADGGIAIQDGQTNTLAIFAPSCNGETQVVDFAYSADSVLQLVRSALLPPSATNEIITITSLRVWTTKTPALVGQINDFASQIVLVDTPEEDRQAANKSYVDDQAEAAISTAHAETWSRSADTQLNEFNLMFGERFSMREEGENLNLYYGGTLLYTWAGGGVIVPKITAISSTTNSISLTVTARTNGNYSAAYSVDFASWITIPTNETTQTIASSKSILLTFSNPAPSSSTLYFSVSSITAPTTTPKSRSLAAATIGLDDNPIATQTWVEDYVSTNAGTGGGLTASETGQIATNVLSTATTSSLPNIPWASLGGSPSAGAITSLVVNGLPVPQTNGNAYLSITTSGGIYASNTPGNVELFLSSFPAWAGVGSNRVSFVAVTNASQFFTVPSGVTNLAAWVWGGGGSGVSCVGGSSFVSFPVTPGENLELRVALAPLSISITNDFVPGAWPGGGTGFRTNAGTINQAGGYCGVFRGENPLVISGGGGVTTASGPGGAGGGISGGNGHSGGGTQLAGGYAQSTNQTAGSYLQGGGALSTNVISYGGGGGYFGGGGSGYGANSGAGSGFVNGSLGVFGYTFRGQVGTELPEYITGKGGVGQSGLIVLGY